MGVDLKVMLFTRPDPREVAQVLALLDGCPKSWTDIPSLDVATAKAVPCGDSLAGHSLLQWTSPEDGPRSWMWHWTLDHADFSGAIPRSTAKNLALACGLVDFFGGIVQFDDCSEFPHSHLGRPDGVIWQACNGKMWKLYQESKAEIKPLTRNQVESYDKYAAYKLAEMT